MKASNSLWKANIQDQIPANLDKEIDVFEAEITLQNRAKSRKRCSRKRAFAEAATVSAMTMDGA